MKSIFYSCLIVLLGFYGCSGQKDKKEKEPKERQKDLAKTFTNPLLPSGPDPYSTYHNGYYHYMSTEGNKLVLKRVKNLANLKNAEVKTIWTPPEGTLYSHNIWAPEIHYIDGRWYSYFAADDGNNVNHRMYVIENTSEDPFTGTFEFKGKIAAATDKWAIDGNVFEFKGQLYMIWSGWEGDDNGQQDIFIAKMKNPIEIEGDRVKISSPTNDWEKHWNTGTSDENPPHVLVNEGPQFLTHDNKIFIVFSASGCWTDYYSLGLLTFTGTDNLLDPQNWLKSPEPIFTQSPENEVYGPGHNSFFKSPDGTEDWILYHANSKPGEGCGPLRSPRMQKIGWDENSYPILGKPASEKEEMEIPSE
ncbi:glycoside hydrolase family 43 protein [Maribacter cobaltidurans]|uniref:Glycosyl hydrolase family 43 n=1 Tax=Maribacter cobaltidurans TaxID=1178778 RepID=A0A223V4E1_9FLAO|nr:glycoside hydrolase family 43 protein [Maribacter cobaltidurans]ASV29709.1 glycosyl hydrolase family 43 [Maribacter cobaltidurans]GGD66517.1 glycosyl hydrolase family 43 [Maribacter cobaltidurans]